jgi:hypothetical protein
LLASLPWDLWLIDAIISLGPVTWTQWNNTYTIGEPSSGSATGTVGGVGVTYGGELQNLNFTQSDYAAFPSTFSGGVVSNAPLASNGTLYLQGGGSVVDTITFASAVLNPVVSIWSLGNPNVSASFVFNVANTSSVPVSPTFVVGGPDQYAGSGAIAVTGNTVSGLEGSGVVEFLGSFSSISWTNPQGENDYGFTVGTVSAVPEPATWMMMILGFVGVGFASYRRSRRSVGFAAA